MIYGNDDPMALAAMEEDRLGYRDSGQICPVCDIEPEYFYLYEDDECVGCSVCVYETDTLLGEGGQICPVCGAYDPEYYYMDEDDDCIGCSDCVRKTEELY